ncbi:IS110 family transposase [Actinomyces oris]|uniref:Transposase n=1 Tax=Actinomyces oris TaxID=544580 RepID=A0AAW9KNV1_9ACTO|nr:IS110 family transposase [Actinomyces oris]MEA1306101.1 transposase [Actinomyces oris]
MRLSTRSWSITGACWWWWTSLPPSGALAVAVDQDMGITVGYLPGLSMRRIADLAPGSATTDAKDAAVIAQAARTMPQTLRAVSASDEEAAALSMLTGFDLDLARQVKQTEGRIRGQWLTPDPTLGPWPGARRRRWGPSPPGPPQPT